MISGCKTALNELRCNWRHDSILANLMKNLKNSTNKQLALYVDNADYKSPTTITAPSQQPDIFVVDVKNYMLLN